jgi:hypothetical protein
MTTTRYLVHYRCHLCGQTHLVINQLLVPGGPNQTGSLADLYPDGNLPPRIVSFLTNLLWCDQAADYIELQDPARVYLTPRPPPPPLSVLINFLRFSDSTPLALSPHPCYNQDTATARMGSCPTSGCHPVPKCPNG